MLLVSTYPTKALKSASGANLGAERCFFFVPAAHWYMRCTAGRGGGGHKEISREQISSLFKSVVAGALARSAISGITREVKKRSRLYVGRAIARRFSRHKKPYSAVLYCCSIKRSRQLLCAVL